MLTVKSLHFKSGNSYLIHNFCHQFTPGTIYGVLGLNGSGKTTLLKLLCGILKKSSGTLLWNNIDLDEISRIERSRIMTLVGQTLPINFSYTAEDIVAMGTYANINQVNKGPIVTSALKQMDADQFAKRPITQLSNGEKQRVFLARALAAECPILLFDEPTANLDIKYQKNVWQLLGSLKKENKVLIIATHDLEHAENHCDHLLLIHESRCIADGSFSELKENPDSAFFFSFL